MRWRPSARTSLAPCARMCSRHAHTFVVELAGAWLDVDRRQVHRLRSRHSSEHHHSKPTPRHPANQTQALSLVCGCVVALRRLEGHRPKHARTDQSINESSLSWLLLAMPEGKPHQCILYAISQTCTISAISVRACTRAGGSDAADGYISALATNCMIVGYHGR
jgi:hypothetical protein